MTILLGLFAVGQDSALGEFTREQVEQIGEQLASQIINENPIIVSIFIFMNNLQACILLFLGGATMGIFTMFILSFNGTLIGAIIGLALPEKGAIWVAAALIPHGIFEIPAILLASAFGLMLGEALLKEMWGSGDAAAIAKTLGGKFLVFVIPLLAVAAVIEAFITPQILNLVI